MHNRIMKLNLLLICFIYFQLISQKAQSQESHKLPNIIFILVDDMGYGDPKSFNPQSKISTPNIDKLAASGMMFTDAHASASSCIPSRYGLLTGRYPFRAKHFNWRSEPLIDEDQLTIASVLQKNGYYTGMVGKWHLGFDYSDYNNLTGGPVDRGFDYYFGISRSLDQADYYYIQDRHAVQAPTDSIPASVGYGKNGWQGAFWRKGKAAKNFKHDEVLNTFTQKSIDFIENAAKDSNPFFLYLALASPHTPWLASEKFKGTSEIGDWGDWVAENDDAIGKVLKAVSDNGISENTLIIFTSDNGPVWWPADIETYGHRATSIYRGMKFDAWEGGHRMPFIASWPGMIAQGSQSSRIVSNTDMLATFADLVGETLTAKSGEDSYSILDALYNKENTKPIREVIVGWAGYSELYIRKGDWKLIGTDQLYNLATDPSEQNNVYKNNKNIASELLTLLEQYKIEGRSTPKPELASVETSPLPELINVWDPVKVRYRGPILIAHRGGVVEPNIPECSKMAVKMAAVYKYDMVELDIQESKDHHPIVFHDRNMMQASGIDKKISDLTLEELSKINFVNSEEYITSLEDMLRLCSSLNLGVMLDIKSDGKNELFFKGILALIEKYQLDKACMLLGNAKAREQLKGKALLTLPKEMLDRVKQGESVDLKGYYWFGVPETWPLELIKPIQEYGALVIPALNIFRYSKENHRTEAHHDAKRLLNAGADGFQIDCIYQDYFQRPKVYEFK